ncbi:ABC transporter permease [Ruegeria arenilitoris]|uniref:ABC transporter permease n=1 Tax=Ruegeria arenilitoris TaxID=1173585 RepID=UPI00147FB0F9|nr:ABC transporter permease [Ruegeria arenilitoris]
MNGQVIQVLVSHWRRHLLQTITLLIGISLATALWSAVQAINAEAKASYARASDQLALGQFDEIRDPSGNMQLSHYVDLRRAGWQVSAVLDGSMRVGGRYVQVMGVDMVSAPPLPAITQVENVPSPPEPVDLLTAPGRLLIAPELQDVFEDQDGFPPVIVSDALPPGYVLTDIGVAERLLNRSGQVSRLLVLPEQPLGVIPLSELAPDLVRVVPSAQMDTAQLTDSFHLNLSAFGLLSFAVGLFIVHSTVGLAFAQRRGMIRTLRALGVPMQRLVQIVLGELVLISVVGGSIGLVLGFFIAGALLPDVAATLRGLYGAPVEGQLTLRTAWALSGLAMAVGGTLIASGQSLWRLYKMPLLEGPGRQSWLGSTISWRITALVGGALMAGGTILFATVGGLIAGFTMLAGLLTGAALLLPLALSSTVALVSARTRGPVAQWVWADMRTQLPGLSLALMALMLALAANIGVGTMVSSFRLTFVGWLDQRLVSELYLTTNDEEQAKRINEWLASQVDAILPIRSIELPHETGALFLYGVVDDPAYRQHWPLIAQTSDAWSQVIQNSAVLINEQLARRSDLWPGEKLRLTPNHILPIAGVYSDYGNPTGQAIVSMSLFEEVAPNARANRFGIRTKPEGAAELALALRQQFNLPPNAVVQQAEMKNQSLAIFEKTFLITSALNVLTLGVAGFAILTSLLTLWTQRLPQVAPVWALGLTRTELSRLELLRSVLLATLTACMALPLGLALAWILLAVINVEAFGWRLPMYLFPTDWLRLFTLTILAAALAAALPSLRLIRMRPAELLQVFANER